MGIRLALLAGLLLLPAPGLAQDDRQQVVQALQSSRFQFALDRVETLLNANPGDPALLTLRGMALRGLERSDDGLAAFRDVLARQHDYLPALQGAAEIEYATRDTRARETLEKILRIQPQNATAHAMLAVLEAERLNCGQAVEHFDSAGEAIRGNVSALWRQAACLFEIARLADAERAYRQVLDLRPQHPQATFNLGLTLFRQGQYDAAIQILAPRAAEDAADAERLSLLADAYERANRTPEAAATLQDAVKRYPRHEQLYLQLAELCIDHGSHGLADEVLKAAVHNVGESARLHTARGVVYAQLERLEESASEFEKASRLASGNELAAMGLNLTLQQEGRLAEAVQLLREQLKKNPAQPDLNYLLAQALMRQGVAPDTPDFEEARRSLERAIAADPESARSHAALGQLYLKGGETAAAIKQLERSLELDPAERTASYQLMLALRKAGRNAEAAALTQKVRHLIDEARQKEVERGRYRLIRAAETPDR